MSALDDNWAERSRRIDACGVHDWVEDIGPGGIGIRWCGKKGCPAEQRIDPANGCSDG